MMILFRFVYILTLTKTVKGFFEDDSFSFCLKRIVDGYFNGDEHSEVISDGFNETYPKFFRSIVLYSLESKMEGDDFNLIKTKNYYIHLSHTKSDEAFRKISELSTWNPKAKFLITSELETHREVLKTAAKYLCQHTIALEVTTKKILLYSWSHYEMACKNRLIIHQLDECTNGIFLEDNQLFQTEKNYDGCVLRILAATIPPYVFYKNKILDGLEIRYLKTIEKFIRIKIEFIQHDIPTWGLKLPNGTYTGMFNLVVNRKADAVVGMLPTNYTHIWDFDVSMSYLEESLVWLIPKSQIQPHWKRLSRIFPETIWMILLVVIMVLPLIWAVTGNNSYGIETSSFLNYQTCILKSVSIILSITIPRYPKTSPLRILFISWVYVSLILTTLYQSRLLTILIQPHYEYQISTVEELLESGMKFGANVNVKALYDVTASRIEEEMHNRMIKCDLTLTCPNRTAFQRDFATAKARLSATFLILEYYTNSEEIPMIHIIDSPIFSHYINIAFIRGHLLFDRFDQLLWRISESGLFIKWLNDIKQERMIHTFMHRNTSSKSLVLSLEHMSAPFITLLTGYLLSSTVFLLENIRFYFQKKGIETKGIITLKKPRK